MQVTKDKVVTLEYTTTDDEGRVVDTTDHAREFSFIQGRGAIFPALEEALEGRNMGERLKVTLTPEQAYGRRDESLVKKVPRSHIRIPGEIEVGVLLKSSKGNSRTPIKIIDFDEETVTLDANNPLAGLTLRVDLVITDVRDALPEELESGRVQDMEEIYGREQGGGVEVEFKP
ncbi:MAG TPA: peptidylprolyl isomerase [Sedimenticola sp.]|nr:peptidylprolyl isomerase [Sedimenticola sp.]